MSKYFLDGKEEQLVHGVELFRELYDERTIEEILKDRIEEQRMFSIQRVKAAFEAHYLEYGHDELFRGFIRMLLHDAIIGVQDRHTENWGVIVQRSKSVRPRFAPIYDSARGLLCTHSDSELKRKFIVHPRGIRQCIADYATKAHPLIGWDGEARLNHYELIARVYHEYPELRSEIDEVLARFDWMRFVSEIREQRFLYGLVSSMRLELVRLLIRARIRAIRRAIHVYGAQLNSR